MDQAVVSVSSGSQLSIVNDEHSIILGGVQLKRGWELGDKGWELGDEGMGSGRRGRGS